MRNKIQALKYVFTFTTLIAFSSPLLAGICWDIFDGQVGKTILVSEPRSANPISLNNHRCRDIANGVWSQRFENQQVTQVELSVEASGVFKGADLGFNGSISEETSKTKTVELELPKTLPKCTHWARLFTDEFRVKRFRYHVRQFSLQYGTQDFYSGTLNHCAFRRSGTPANFIATVKNHIMISYIDQPEPVACLDNDECRRCNETTDTSANIDESDDDSDTNDPGNTRELGYRLDDLGKRAFSLGTPGAYATNLPSGYAFTGTGNSIMTTEGLVSYEEGRLTIVNEEYTEPVQVNFKPLVLMDGTVFSRRGLILLQNGGVLRFANSQYALAENTEEK